ncbi:MAG: leucine-rich repeat domain-containing protein [Clostridia bacterium]|nr:leucine-rich repeat domain-containing protein [Clostridia bacterium]
MKKKFLCCFTVVSLMACLLVIPALANTDGFYTYSVENGVATITKCDTAIKGDVTIPETLGGYTVTSIGREAFYGCEGIENIQIPNSVTQIGKLAFLECRNLLSITLPGGIEKIDDFTFYYCESLKSIQIPDNVKSIGIYAFSGCRSLSDVSIPDSVTVIENSAFSECVSLKSIVIPDNVKKINSYAFSYCTNLEKIELLGDSVILGKSVFQKCENLSDIYYSGNENGWNMAAGSESFGNAVVHKLYGAVSDEDYSYIVSNGGARIVECKKTSTNIKIPNTLGEYPVTAIGACAFYEGYAIQTVEIPNTVVSIGNSAFAYCDGITSINLPKSLKIIGSYAFNYCTGMEGIYIPDTVREIGECAFQRCTSLSGIDIPNGVTSIQDGTFRRCSALSNISIPSTVSSIGAGATAYCSKLNDVYYSGSNREWSKISIGNDNTYLMNADIHYLKNPSTKTVINDDGLTVSFSDTDNGNVVILALYQDKQFKDLQYKVYNGESIVFKTDTNYDTAKIMVWNSFDKMEFITSPEIISK